MTWKVDTVISDNHTFGSGVWNPLNGFLKPWLV